MALLPQPLVRRGQPAPAGVVKHGDSAIVEQLQSQQDREDNYFIYAVAASIMAQSKHHWRLHRCQGRAPCTDTETPGVV